jgi:DNA replication protein DnaC
MVQQTIEKLRTMKLSGMARAFEDQIAQPSYDKLSYQERVAMLVDQEYTYRENRKLAARLKSAHLKLDASIEDIDFRKSRGLDRSVIMSLATCDWIRHHHNVVIIGATGSGKSYIGEALAQKACREGFPADIYRSTKLFAALDTARKDGSYRKLLNKLKRTNPLVLDDLPLNPLNDAERRDLLEIMEDRYGFSSTVLTSQYPVAEWHTLIGGPTLADAILDRIDHNSHRIELKGESMRKIKSNLKK